MYDVVVTKGLVLGKRGVGEANTLVSIVTADLGLVRASARSSRAEKSKLRYVLEPLTMGRFSLIRGRHEWRLTGAEAAERAFSAALPERRTAAGRISRLLIRLIQGQEPVPALFDVVESGFAALASVPDDEAVGVEYITVLRIVSLLGYLPQSRALEQFVGTSSYGRDLNLQAGSMKPALAKAINTALEVSGL
ncbi:MAG: repair protein RecO, repair protein RecO [Candidatus Adlerbacteria bacterium]|nr:repair protein RecO, repair protein RecO [Candidatus Adlerbacteria bacterium]